MRTLSLVDCAVLKFGGSILKNAICFGDVDNDGLNEFVIGSSEGELGIFREDQRRCTATDLGAIAAVAVGDLLNIGRNVLVVVTIEGRCHIFDVESELASLDRAYLVTEGDSPPQFLPPDTSMIWPYHSQRIPPNTKTLHLGDVNGDGLVEMVLGLTDRVVRTYQWKSENLDNVVRTEIVRVIDAHLDLRLFEVEVSTNTAIPILHYLFQEDKQDTKGLRREDTVYGRLCGLNKWEFSSQVGSISLHHEDGLLSILVSQPGGIVKKITEAKPALAGGNPSASAIGISSSTSTLTASVTSKGDNHEPRSRTTSEGQTEQQKILRRTDSTGENFTIDYFTVLDSNQSISCEVAGNVIGTTGNDDCYAIATLDGTILIAKRNEVIWKMEVEHQVMSLFQVNGDILACTWDGETYFIQGMIPTRFHFEESVATFVPGRYGVREEGDSSTTDDIVNKLCMAFVTFDEKVYIYPVPSITLAG